MFLIVSVLITAAVTACPVKSDAAAVCAKAGTSERRGAHEAHDTFGSKLREAKAAEGIRRHPKAPNVCKALLTVVTVVCCEWTDCEQSGAFKIR